MARWINTFEVICPDANREKEWIEWYKKIHAPDILETPGFLTARLYERKEFRDGRGKFLTIYEIETDDIDKTIKVRQEKRAKEVEAGRGSTAFLPVWRDVVWKQITRVVADKESDPKMEKWLNTLEIVCADDNRAKEFTTWYEKTHARDILDTPGFLTARMFERKEFRDGRGLFLTMYEIETDDIDKTLEIRKQKRIKEREQGRQTDAWIPMWFDVLWRLLFELSK